MNALRAKTAFTPHLTRIVVVLLSVTAQARAETPVQFDIASQPLVPALKAFAEQANMQLLYKHESVASASANAVVGRFEKRSALTQLLRGTGLEAVFISHNAATIRPAQPKPAAEATAPEGSLHLARAEAAAAAKGGDEDMSAAQRAPQEARAGAMDDSSATQRGEQRAEIIVTGTHIRGVGTSPTAPVVSISREEILDRGYTSVEEVLRSASMNFSNVSSSSHVNPNSGAPPRFVDGLTAVNLRGLGTGATLVLVDGQRVANAPTESGTLVDISKIPLGMIERIDIVTGAASSIYGGDAVAGTINIVTRKDYRGAETFVGFGDSSSNADSYELRQLLGIGWRSGNVTAHFSYQEQDPAESAALGIVTLDQRGRGGQDFRDFTFTQPPQLSRRRATIPGAPPGTRSALLPAGDGRNVTTGDLIYISAAELSTKTGNYNLIIPSDQGLQRNLTPETQNYGGRVSFSQTLSERLDLYLNASYSKRESLTQDFRTPTSEVVPESNAFNNFGQPVEIRYSYFNEIADGLMPAMKARSFSDSMGFGGGLLMDLPWRNWSSKLALSYERARNRSENDELLNVLFGTGQSEVPGAFAAYQAALNSSDPDQALNFFGDGTGHGANLNLNDFRFVRSEGEQLSKLRAANLSFNGDVWQAPAGMVKAAVGVEARRESLDFSDFRLSTFDVQPTRDLKAAFGEVLVPLASGRQEWLLQLAGRYDRYEIEGPFGAGGAVEERTFSEFSPQIGLRWRSGSGLRVKANWSEAFQAPTIQQLFDPADSFPDALFDPVNPASNGGPGVVPFEAKFGGNPDLQPQTATSYTLELAYAPPALPGLTTVIAWSRIRTREVVRSGLGNFSSFTELLENSDQHPGVVRDADGVLQSIAFTPVNAASQVSEAVDFRLFYRLDTPFGVLHPGVVGTYTLELSEQLTPATPVEMFDDTVSGPSAWRVVPSLIWERGNLGANLYINYDSGVRNTSTLSPQREIGSLTTVDAQLSWKAAEKGWRLALGAHNLFDADPPFYDSAYGIDFSRYNAAGRRVYANVTKTFGVR